MEKPKPTQSTPCEEWISTITTLNHIVNEKSKSYAVGFFNGDLKLFFPKKPHADFMLRTPHGAAFTDFPITSLTAQAEQKTTRKKGKFVYKSNHFYRARVGSGGPEIRLDGFNSDIVLGTR